MTESIGSEDGESNGSARQRLNINRGHIRYGLIRDLAEDKTTQRVLAKKYGVVPSAITEFKKRWATEIEAVRSDLESRTAGLWIADKQRRVAVYQQQAEDTAKLLQRHLDQELPCDCEDPECKAKIIGDAGIVGGLQKAQARALRGVAEELGQLPNRMTVVQEGETRVRHIIEGVDLNDV